MHTLAATISGPDRPGIASALLSALGDVDAEVLDFEQVVVRGQLTMGFLLGLQSDAASAVVDRLAGSAVRLGLTCTIDDGATDHPPRHSRAIVTVFGTPLTAEQLGGVTSVIAGFGGNIDRTRRLSRTPLTAIELWVSNADVVALRPALALAASAEGCDVSVSPAGISRHGRRLVVLDVDSTLIQDEVIELLAAHAGREAEVAAVTEAAMRGELDFSQSLHHRVQALTGLPATVLAEVRDAVRLTPGARTLVSTLKAMGCAVGVVSGGFIEIVEPLARDLGIDHAHANALEVVDGRLTGRVAGPVVDRAEKARTLERFAALEHLPMERTIAVGDGANDLDMLARAGLGVAFNAKPAVRAGADTALNVPTLEAVLFLLGLTREEVEEAIAAPG